ncbi:MAG: hypothetical protein AAF628_33485 [Planctomycetota bacterium]
MNRVEVNLGAGALLALCLAGCGTSDQAAEQTLPFHVAVIPVDVDEMGAGLPIEHGGETELSLDFVETEVTQKLVDAASRPFAKTTLLSKPNRGLSKEENYEVWVAEAAESGADLILDATLLFDRKIHTGLNGSFWVNLPFFFIGGPFNWFVNDRSYYFDARLEARVFSAHGIGEVRPPDRRTRVTTLEAQVSEARLDFLDRGDGLGAFALSVVVPSGWVSAESSSVTGKLQDAIAADIGTNLARNAQTDVRQLLRWDRVHFYPEGVGLAADERALEGWFVLELDGNVARLDLRYRTNLEPYRDYDWGDGNRVSWGRQPRKRHYWFHIPIDGEEVRWIQLEVRQAELDATRRTFTYLVDA